MRDPYEVLGIQRGATDDEIKKAYRAKCKRWHPDLNPNDPTAEEHFKEVQTAYDAITKGDTGPQMGGQPGGGYGYGQQGYYQGGYQQGYDQATARTAGNRAISASGSTRLVSDSVLAATSSRAGPATPALTAPRCRRRATL
ncbi:MAG: J domain-containing protein [Faecalibacterium prausnitzii]